MKGLIQFLNQDFISKSMKNVNNILLMTQQTFLFTNKLYQLDINKVSSQIDAKNSSRPFPQFLIK